jgi:hypothetical protein
MDFPAIVDARTQFTAITFSSHKKSAVKHALLLSLSQSRIETSCHWVAEMVCSGYFTEIWDVILLFFAKHIHLGNPKLPLYLELRFNHFKREASEELIELRLRNNLVIRRLFAEIIAVLCTSQKQRSYELVTVNKDDLGITNLHEKLRAPNMSYITVLQDKDPKELYIPLNELAYALDSKNSIDACYWLEWLLLFEEVCAKKKTPCTIQTREYTLRYQQDLIWLFWDVVLSKTPHLKLATATLNLFKIQYSPSAKRRRRFLLYYAVALCCDPLDLTVDIIGNKTVVESVTDKCNVIYKEIKKNEKTIV